MTATMPDVHAALLSLAAALAVAVGGLLLARNPANAAARLHFCYGLVLAWWFICAANIATADGDATVRFWSRLVQLALGLMPGVIYHLNLALAGLREHYPTRIRAHWAGSGALVLFGLFWPGLLGPTVEFAWGPNLSYSAWGLVFVAAIAVTLVEVLFVYRVALARTDPRMVRHQKAKAFLWGNALASLSLVSFLPTFGFNVYPFGFLILTATHGVALYGALRHRLIEVTPEFAAEHVMNEMPDGVLVADADQIIRVLTRPAAEFLGCEVTEAVGRRIGDVGSNFELIELLRAYTGGEPAREISFFDQTGTARYVRSSSSEVTDAAGFPVARLWVLRDVTLEKAADLEKERFEDRVRNVQKLESLGVMASGVAHDFNNLLMAIMGNAELARTTVEDGGELPQIHLQKIEATAQRASELTRQMLTYTGHVPTSRRPIDLNQVVVDVSELLGAAVSKKATLVLELQPDLPLVSGDSSQMSQVILNLLTNASESLEENAGSITLRTGMCRLDDSYQGWSDAPARVGRALHVFLEADDTGVGMDEDVLHRIFDPFFTTKFTGRGLGLATVVGIVRSHSGFTRVDTERGRGTIFRVALPIAETAARENTTWVAPPEEPLREQGLALLADDEPEVRQVVRSMLIRDGFTVMAVGDGREAVRAFAGRSGDFSLVVLDHAMPELNGREVFDQIRASGSGVPIVLMSGYTDAVAEPLDDNTTFLHKPFAADLLTARIREAMNARVESRYP